MRNERSRAFGAMGDGRNAYRVLVGRTEGRRLLERHRRRWENSIRVDFQEVEWGSMDWIALAQNRDKFRVLVNAIMNIRVP